MGETGGITGRSMTPSWPTPATESTITFVTSPRARAAGDRAWLPLAASLSVAGVVHLVRPDVFAGLVPRWLGAPQPWVYGSGAAELACAAGLVAPRSRRL